MTDVEWFMLEIMTEQMLDGLTNGDLIAEVL
jgi:hypothetical protein